jgi:hypothetical protein
MKNNGCNCIYQEMTAERMKYLLDTKFKPLLENFRDFFGKRTGTEESIAYSTPLVSDIFKRIDQRGDYYAYFHTKREGAEQMMMAETKHVALMAYWVIKYKPLSLPRSIADDLYQMKCCTLNEYFAAFCIFSLAKTVPRLKDVNAYFSPKNLDGIVYTFMHRDISKEAMILYVESLVDGSRAG